jgi:hypothetical protein
MSASSWVRLTLLQPMSRGYLEEWRAPQMQSVHVANNLGQAMDLG